MEIAYRLKSLNEKIASSTTKISGSGGLREIKENHQKQLENKKIRLEEIRKEQEEILKDIPKLEQKVLDVEWEEITFGKFISRFIDDINEIRHTEEYDKYKNEQDRFIKRNIRFGEVGYREAIEALMLGATVYGPNKKSYEVFEGFVRSSHVNSEGIRVYEKCTFINDDELVAVLNNLIEPHTIAGGYFIADWLN